MGALGEHSVPEWLRFLICSQSLPTTLLPLVCVGRQLCKSATASRTCWIEERVHANSSCLAFFSWLTLGFERSFIPRPTARIRVSQKERGSWVGQDCSKVR